jgi:penicillin-insensitive murein endopeptidase
MPDRAFVYGKTGWQDGGQLKPHKTRRNSLSVDFMVPVLDESGASIALPSSILDKWGYDLEFDSNGRLDNLEIDFDAIAEHICQLDVAAKGNCIGISRVIFDPHATTTTEQFATVAVPEKERTVLNEAVLGQT